MGPVDDSERTDTCLEEGFAVVKTRLLLQAAAAGLRLKRIKPAAALEQRHLGGQMAALPDVHQPGARPGLGGHEVDVIAATIAAGAYQPHRLAGGSCGKG